MTQPRWTARGLLQNGSTGQDPRNSRTTNRSSLIGLVVGLVLAVLKYATDDTELNTKMRIAAAVGVPLVGRWGSGPVLVSLDCILVIDGLPHRGLGGQNVGAHGRLGPVHVTRADGLDQLQVVLATRLHPG